MTSGFLFGNGPPFDPGAPLAERMRPRSLDEVVGQEHLVGPGGVLRHAAADEEALLDADPLHGGLAGL